MPPRAWLTLKQRAGFPIAQALLAGLIAATLGLPASLHAASWLDGPANQWNTPGMAVPKPTAVPAISFDCAPPDCPPPCNAREARPVTEQESQVAAAGWKLEQYWPAQTLGALTAITALAGYDGMCRPMAFNVFVFSGNRFTGTVSPVPMNSREDGVLFGDASAAADESFTAAFTRYVPNDPSCCPSGGRTTVSYRVDQVSERPVLVAVQVGSFPSALPKTGGGGAQASLLSGYVVAEG